MKKKSKYHGFAQEKGFWLTMIAQFAVASERSNNNNGHLQKRV
jgi:hypothetical protein